MSLPREVELVLDYCVRTMLTEWREFRSRPGFSIDEPIDEKVIAPELVAAEDTLRQYLAQTQPSTVLGILNTKAQASKRKRGTPLPTIVSGAFCIGTPQPLSVAMMITAYNPSDTLRGSARLRIASDSLVYLLSATSFGRAEVSASALRVWVVDDRTLMRRTAQRLEAEAIVRRYWSRLVGSEVQERLKDMVVLRGLGQPAVPVERRDDALAHLRGKSVLGVTSFVAAAIAMGLPLQEILGDP